MTIKPLFCGALICLALAPNSVLADDIPWSPTASIGAGYDSLRAAVRGQCAQLNAASPQQVAGETVKFDYSTIQDESSLIRKLNVSISASYSGFGGSADLSQSVQINSYSSYMMITARVDERTLSGVAAGMPVPKLTDASLSLLTQNPQRFIDQCGQSFIATQTVGGVFTAVVEVHTSSDAEKQVVDVALSGASGAFSGSASAQATLQQVLSNRSVKVTIVRSGGSGPVHISSDQLIASVLSFPQDIKTTPSDQLLPSVATTLDYASLSLPNGISHSTFENLPKERFLDDADHFVTQIMQQRADVQYALANVEQFPTFDQSAFRRFLADADTALENVKFAVRACLDSQSVCASFVPPSITLVTIPVRLDPNLTRPALLAAIARSRSAVSNEFSNGHLNDLCARAAASSPFPNDPLANSIGLSACLSSVQKVKAECSSAGCFP